MLGGLACRVAPSAASSALFAETTLAPCSKAVVISVRTGSMPPITSTTTSMSPRLTSAVASVVTSSAGTPSRTRSGRRTAIPASSTGRADPGGEVVARASS